MSRIIYVKYHYIIHFRTTLIYKINQWEWRHFYLLNSCGDGEQRGISVLAEEYYIGKLKEMKVKH